MKMSQTSAYLLLLAIALSCMTKNEKDSQSEQIDSELAVIDSLLRNEAFALEMAKTLDAAYYAGVGQPPAPFLSPQDDTARVKTSRRDEKIAINIAGFYALECGLGAICASTNQKPTDLLQTIVEQKADSATVLLLNRFANATWKAGQPFRGLDRITRPNFIVASLLSKEEVKKDYDQIQAASGKLLSAMQEVRDSSMAGQMRKLKSLLQREQFASDMAASQEAAYYTAQRKPVPPFLTPGEAKATVMKSVKEQKISDEHSRFLRAGMRPQLFSDHSAKTSVGHSENNCRRHH